MKMELRETDFLSLLFLLLLCVLRSSAASAQISSARCGISSALILLFSLLACLPLAGCWQTPAFRPNTEGRDPAGIDASRARAIGEAMASLSARPTSPSSRPARACGSNLLRVAAGPTASDAEGMRCGLFRRHCVTCHGISGDGAGPSAAVLVPYPRDYRDGLFKYTSTAGGAKPVRADLERHAAPRPARHRHAVLPRRWRRRRSTPWSSTSSI